MSRLPPSYLIYLKIFISKLGMALRISVGAGDTLTKMRISWREGAGARGDGGGGGKEEKVGGQASFLFSGLQTYIITLKFFVVVFS